MICKERESRGKRERLIYSNLRREQVYIGPWGRVHPWIRRGVSLVAAPIRNGRTWGEDPLGGPNRGVADYRIVSRIW